MQTSFDFGGAAEIAGMRQALAAQLGRLGPVERLDPMSQLMRSMLGSRTRDAVSWAAFERLRRHYPRWAALAAEPHGAVAAAIAPVTHAERKAEQIGLTLRLLLAEDPGLRLAPLAGLPLREAMAWLERLPGVGPKIAASVLNFSTLDRPAFVVDTHVLRVLRRFGFVGPRADARRAHEAVMAATQGWAAWELVELHVLTKRLGQEVCRARDVACAACPLRGRCLAAREG